MHRKNILTVIVLILVSLAAVQLYPKDDRKLGKVITVNPSSGEITVSIDSGEKINIGERIFTRSGDSTIIMRSTFPMMTVTKCRVEDKYKQYLNLVKPGMDVFFYVKDAAAESVSADKDTTAGKASKFGTIEMVYIKGGEFIMGSPGSEMDRSEDEQQHKVKLSPFWMGKYEVTIESYREIMGRTPEDESNEPGTDGEPVKPVNVKHPVTWIGRDDAIRFCNKMSEKYGLKPCYKITEDNAEENYYMNNITVTCDFSANGFRLPTEAEWEFACRGGTATAYSTGDTIDGTMANFGRDYNSETLLPAGSFKPNRFGLYDMHGNASEFCWDWYNADYYSTSPAENPEGPGMADPSSFRVFRGGNSGEEPGRVRSASRPNWFPEGGMSEFIGFRVCRSAGK